MLAPHQDVRFFSSSRASISLTKSLRDGQLKQKLPILMETGMHLDWQCCLLVG
jgi:hypothetical protein